MKNDQQRPQQMVIPSKEIATLNQVNILLGAAATCMNFIGTIARTGEDTDLPAIDGGAMMATEVTLVGIMDRLDRIVKDEGRWTVDGLKDLENATKDALAAQTVAALQAAQTQAFLRSPHIRTAPVLVRLPDGAFAAVLGDPSDPASIIGTGASPAAALENFDEIFCGLKQQQQKQTNEHATVDGSGSATTDGTAPAGNDLPEDSAGDGEKRKVGRKKVGKNSRRRSKRAGGSGGENPS